MKSKTPNLARDACDIKQLSSLLGLTEKEIGDAVTKGGLRCGILARSWKGHCYTNLGVPGREILARQFWYLNNISTDELFNISKDGTAPIPFLTLYDGEGSHQEDPDAFPSAKCYFSPHERYEKTISIDDVLFLTEDLQEYLINA